jgi:hypothetical protein
MQDEARTAALVPAQEPVELGLMSADSPRALMEQAADMATELAKLIQARRLFTVLRNKPYVVVEGWTTLGTMLGVVAREVSTTEHDGIYTAVVELVRISDGTVISRASAECGADDERDRNGKPIWANRPRYARRSMAQTRATGKACRLAFSWIMKLAGYEPTPAEEMIFAEDAETVSKRTEGKNPQPAPPQAPPRTPPKQGGGTGPKTSPQFIPPGDRISEAQHRRLEARISELRLDRRRVKELCSKWFGEFHLNRLGKNQYAYLDKRLEKLKAQTEKELGQPELRLESMERCLREYLRDFDEPPAGNAVKIVSIAWSEAGKRHGEWPSDDPIDNANFFRLVQEEIDGRVPVGCRDCDAALPSVIAAKTDGWIEDSPRRPGPVAYVCPDCQKKKVQ